MSRATYPALLIWRVPIIPHRNNHQSLHPLTTISRSLITHNLSKSIMGSLNNTQERVGDTYGSNKSCSESLCESLRPVIGGSGVFDAHESSYWGCYYKLETDLTEIIKVNDNAWKDEDDEVLFPEYSQYLSIIRVEEIDSHRADELRMRLESVGLVFLHRDNL